MLSVALCVPAIPGAYGYAATSGTTFTQEEEIALSGLGSERSTLFNDGWKFSLSDPSGAESTSFNDGSWDAVTLPHDFSISQNFTTSGEAEKADSYRAEPDGTVKALPYLQDATESLLS